MGLQFMFFADGFEEIKLYFCGCDETRRTERRNGDGNP